MSLHAKVISILEDGKKATVKVKPVVHCNGCKACAGLLKAGKNNLKEQEIIVFTNGHDIKENDTVKIELTEYQGSKAALILYGIPILGFLCGMLLSPIFSDIFSIQVNDTIRIIGAIIGFLLSIAAITIYLKKTRNDAFLMHITSKIEDVKPDSN